MIKSYNYCLFIILCSLVSSCQSNKEISSNELPNIILSRKAYQYTDSIQSILPEYVCIYSGTNKGAISTLIFEHLIQLSKGYNSSTDEQNNSYSFVINENHQVSFIEESIKILNNQSSKGKFELSVEKSWSQFDDDYQITHIKNTYSDLIFDGSITLDYSDTIAMHNYFQVKSYPYDYDFSNVSILNNHITFYKYFGNIAYHFKLEYKDDNGNKKSSYLIVPVYDRNTLYSPHKLTNKEAKSIQ